MIATKEYMIELYNKFDITVYTSREAPTEAFIQWYNDHKDKKDGVLRLDSMDVESALMCFDEDLNELWKEDM